MHVYYLFQISNFISFCDVWIQFINTVFVSLAIYQDSLHKAQKDLRSQIFLKGLKFIFLETNCTIKEKKSLSFTYVSFINRYLQNILRKPCHMAEKENWKNNSFWIFRFQKIINGIFTNWLQHLRQKNTIFQNVFSIYNYTKQFGR